MNLHNITPISEKRWLWLEARSSAYRNLGTHAWEVEIGTPPPLTRPQRTGRTPTRFSWQAFGQVGSLFSQGWIQPLCGRRTTSTTQHANIAYQFSPVCQNCLTIANQRTITVDFYNRIVENLDIIQNIRAEYETWIDNGGLFNDGQDNTPVTMEVFERTVTLPDTWRGTILARNRTTIRWQGGNPAPVQLAMGDTLTVNEGTTPIRTRPVQPETWWNPDLNLTPGVAPLIFPTTVNT